MADFQTWAKLAAYVVSIGIGLEIAHRIYWALNRQLMQYNVPIATKTIMSSTLACIPLMAAVAITSIFCNYADSTSISSLGIGWRQDSLLHLSSGVMIGGTCVGVMFLAGCSIGWFKVSQSPFSDDAGKIVPSFCGATTDLFSAAIFEELTMRGYVFTILNNAWGLSAAVYGSAIIFSLFHLSKHPKLPVFFTINAFAFGVLAAQSRAITGSLWLPVGLHFGWNMAMGPVFGLPCAGKAYQNGLVECVVDGPSWITGGYYSPAAGILGTIALIMATVGLLIVVPV